MKENRVVYFDWLRILATLAVVTIHCSVNDSLEFNSLESKIVDVYYYISQWAVPVFVMISGALFLGKDISLSKLYKHSILRIVTAFGFWSVVYALWRYFITHEKHSVREVVLAIIRGNYHMWFLFIIAGLYLVVPILNAIVANKKTAYYFVVLSFLFSFLLPQVVEVIGYKYAGPYLLLGELLSNLRLDIVLGYSGYFILGYLIKEMYIDRKLEICIYILGLIGFAVTVFVTSWLKNNNISPFAFTDEMSVNIWLMSISVFVFAKQHLNKPFKNEKANNRLSYLSKCTFGVYLVHPMIIDCLNRLFSYAELSFNPIVSVPVTILLVFVCSMGVSVIFNKIPCVKKWLV